MKMKWIAVLFALMSLGCGGGGAPVPSSAANTGGGGALAPASAANVPASAVFTNRTETLIARLADGTEWTSHARGVKPLLDILDGDRARFAGAVCYDRIVGRAAAFLYVKIGVAEVHAPVMSEGAAAIFDRHGIRREATTFVPAIRNRKGDGMCPMDTAVKDISDGETDAAVAALRAKVRALSR